MRSSDYQAPWSVCVTWTTPACANEMGNDAVMGSRSSACVFTLEEKCQEGMGRRLSWLERNVLAQSSVKTEEIMMRMRGTGLRGK